MECYCPDTLNYLLLFNHIHIFIDPNPDPEISFKERERLFNLPRSNWTDYDKKLISKGGAYLTVTLNPLVLARK